MKDLAVIDPRVKAETIFDNLDVSEATRTDYKYRISLFVSFVKNDGLHRNSFLNFKRTLASRTDFSVSTKNKYLTTARIFLKELNRLGYLPVDITQNIKSFAQIKKHKLDGLSRVEIEKLSQLIRELPPTPQNERLKALFCLLALQGLRQIEIIRLDVEDLDLVNKTAMVRGKGRDDKEMLYLSPETAKVLKQYITANKVGSGALFRSLSNRKSERMTTMTVRREMKAVFEKLGIKKTVHGYRHFFITTLLGSLDVRDVRKFSRHKSLEMLIVYDDETDTKEKAEAVFRCFKGVKIASNVR